MTTEQAPPSPSAPVPERDGRQGRRVVKPMVGLHAALAQAVTDALDECGMSQATLAATLGMSQKHVSQMLTGTAPGTLAVWNLMLFTLSVRTIEVDWSPTRQNEHLAR